MTAHGNYEVFEEIGRGPRTVVYAGYNPLTKRNVAIKALADPTDPDDLRLLQDTARFLAELPDYAHLVEVKDVIPANGWLVLDRMRESLADRLARDGRGLPADLVRSVLRQALKGLAVLHAAGRWAGNVAPSNLLVNDDGRVKLGDSPGLVVDGVVRPPRGRPKYLAPERIEASFGEVGPQTDLYGLGFTALELLAGPAFDEKFTGTGRDAVNPDAGWLRVHGSKAEPIPPATSFARLPADLARVIDRLVQKEVGKRYPTAEAALADLGAGGPDLLLTDEAPAGAAAAPPAAPPSSPGEKAGPVPRPAPAPGRKRPVVRYAAAGLLAVLLAAAAVAFFLPAGPQTASVTIETQPPGAKVTFLDTNKESPTRTPGPFVVAVKGAARKVRVELDGHEPAELEIDPSQSDRYEVALRKTGGDTAAGPPATTTGGTTPPPPPAARPVTIATDPPGATVVWPDATVPAGRRTPAEFQVEPGRTYQVRLELDGYVPKEIEVRPGLDQYSAALAPVPPPPTTVRIVSRPDAGLEVTIDGAARGKTPLEVKLAPGAYSVAVGRPGAPPVARRVTVRPGGPQEEVWDLPRPAPSEDPEVVTALAGADDWVRKGGRLAGYLEREATPPRLARWKERAAGGDAAAKTLLAHALAEGVGGPKDEPAAVKLYEEGRRAGNGSATYWLAEAHVTGKGAAKDDKAALALFHEAQAAGHPLAPYSLGRMYVLGRGTPKDDAQAVKWFEAAAVLDDAAGLYHLGLMTEQGRGGLDKDDAAAAELYRRAVGFNYPPAVNNLGVLYQAGRGVPRDEGKAAELFRRSADLGNPEGMYNTGKMAARSGGADALAEAAGWFKKSADLGYPAAKASLGVMVEKGQGGLEKDPARAAALYREAADHGNPMGMYHLGLMYEAGLGGLGRDPAEAERWFRRAADLGHPQAREKLHPPAKKP